MLSYSPLTDAYVDTMAPSTESQKPDRRRRRRERPDAETDSEANEHINTSTLMAQPQPSQSVPLSRNAWRPYNDWDHVIPYAVILTTVAVVSMLYEMKTTLVDIRTLLNQCVRPRGGMMLRDFAAAV